MLEDKGWEDPRSVNSPRRILSFSKNRKATVFFPDPDDRDSGFGVSGDQGPKTSEVYGFVGSITTVVATVTYSYLLVRLLGLPGNACAQASPVSGYRVDSFSGVGISSRTLVALFGNCLLSKQVKKMYWALAAPAYAMMTISLAAGFYIGLNFLATPPPSFSLIYDEFTREPLRNVPSTDNDEQPIEPISDIRIDQINDLMFNPR
ncbi:hypothetical protein MTR67_004465 [Solanum verrucosum]|uniref:PIG-P domain-containing protein n=1 Tax=Solanum verrucosum TaxID=315347 RepID=A0AAF0TF44_SOLVR|nr:hypothetical protein MTR67_004465 [Solanum verrucosum]